MSECHGVVYTKEWVVNLVLDVAGYTTDKPLWNKIIVEPSCGHGSFLHEIVRRLLATAKRDDVLDAGLLQKCIRCFDLDKEAVSQCKGYAVDALIDYGLDKEVALETAEKWIVCDDYLLHDDAFADYVVGNPPYVRASDIPVETRAQYVSKFSAMTNGCDLFVSFFQKGLESIRFNNGVLCFICADRWMQNQYGRELRGLISSCYHIDTIVRMHGVDAFEADVSAYPAIVRIDLGDGMIKYADCSSKFSSEDVAELKECFNSHNGDYHGRQFSATQLLQPESDAVIPLADPQKIENVTRLMEKFPTLEGSGVKIGIGLATGKDSIYIVDDPTVVEADRTLPMFNMRDWRKTRTTDSSWLVNPWGKDGHLVNLSDYPLMKSYFEQHKGAIASRHVAKKNPESWYRTIDKINWDIYGTPMLLFPDMSMKADPVYSDGTRYPCHNCYWLVSDNWDIKVLGGLLMSDVAESFVDVLGVKMRGGTKRFQAQYLRLIHVPRPESISSETSDRLRNAFITGDRKAANKAALSAYGLEG